MTSSSDPEASQEGLPALGESPSPRWSQTLLITHGPSVWVLLFIQLPTRLIGDAALGRRLSAALGDLMLAVFAPPLLILEAVFGSLHLDALGWILGAPVTVAVVGRVRRLQASPSMQFPVPIVCLFVVLLYALWCLAISLLSAPFAGGGMIA